MDLLSPLKPVNNRLTRGVRYLEQTQVTNPVDADTPMAAHCLGSLARNQLMIQVVTRLFVPVFVSCLLARNPANAARANRRSEPACSKNQ